MAIANFDRSLWRSGNSGTGFRPASHATHAEIRRPGSRSRGPLERTFVRTEGGALVDLILRYEVVAAFLDLELAQAYRDPECLEVEKHIREIVEVGLPHVLDRS